MLKNHSFNKPSILAPAGHFSSILYQYLPEEVKHNILFSIDNDKQKQNKRVYGTNIFAYSFEEGKSILNKLNIKDKIDIIIINCPYQNEIKNQILKTFDLNKINIIFLKR